MFDFFFLKNNFLGKKCYFLCSGGDLGKINFLVKQVLIFCAEVIQGVILGNKNFGRSAMSEHLSVCALHHALHWKTFAGSVSYVGPVSYVCASVSLCIAPCPLLENVCWVGQLCLCICQSVHCTMPFTRNHFRFHLRPLV